METILCEHGCGQIAEFVNKSGKHTCKPHVSQCQAIKKKNSEGQKRSYKSGERAKVDCFGESRAWSKGKNMLTDPRVSKNKLVESDVFCENSVVCRGYVKKILIQEGHGKRCEICNLDTWLEKPLILHLDHINGDSNDNRKENLRFICPNCHSQTSTYCGKNINKKPKNVQVEEWIEALKNEDSIFKALKHLKLSISKSNYEKALKLKEEFRL